MPSLLWQMRSHYAELSCHSNGNGEIIITKDIMPWHLSHLCPQEREEKIEFINRITAHYRMRLRALNVPLGDRYECHAENGRVIHTFLYAGESADRIIPTAGRDERKTLIVKILNAVKDVLTQDEPAVGIDLRLSNFCRDESRQILYIDLFPALCFFEGAYHVHFPNPQDEESIQRELQRKFTPFGILRRFRFTVLMADTGLEPILNAAISQVMGDVFAEQICDYFAQLPDRQLIGADTKKTSALIKSITSEDTDAAREMALRIVPHNEERPSVLAKVFDLSSAFSSSGIPQEERLRELKRVLHSYVT